MKQFARCTSCREWFVHHAVATVEIVRSSGHLRTTLWCQGCIQETERRSQVPSEPVVVQQPSHTAVSLHVPKSSVGGVPTGDSQSLMQEHLDLMERALHEDDTTIILLVEDFVERCDAHQTQPIPPEDVTRLQSHMQYWSTFLTAMKQNG